MRIVRHPETRTILFHFESCAEYASLVNARCIAVERGAWAGGETWAQSVDRARRGDIALVPQAEALVDKLTVDAQRVKPEWMPEVAGAFPIVPAFLAGQPDCMMEMFPQPNDRAPIRLYVELTSSGRISAADMVKRGTAILALTLLLNMERAVELHALVGLDASADGNKASFCVIPLGTSPLDIALACNALTSVGFVRAMGYQWLMQSRESRSMGGWEWGLHPENERNRIEYTRRLRSALGATVEDIIIPPIHINDPVLRDPLGFVKRALADALKVEQDA